MRINNWTVGERAVVVSFEGTKAEAILCAGDSTITHIARTGTITLANHQRFKLLPSSVTNCAPSEHHGIKGVYRCGDPVLGFTLRKPPATMQALLDVRAHSNLRCERDIANVVLNALSAGSIELEDVPDVYAKRITRI